MYNKCFLYLEDKFNEMIKLWEELVNIDSGSSNKTGVDRVAKIICSELTKIGFDLEVLYFENAGNSVLATKKGRERDVKIVLLGHMDTVFPEGTAGQRPFHIRNGRAYGPGVLDMKGGLVQIIYALKALHHISWEECSIQVILAGDEEVGHVNTNVPDVIRQEAKGAAAVFCCESGRTDGKLVIGRKGVGKLKLTVYGKAAHAGNEPEKGASAVLELASKILKIQNLEDKSKGLTINTGIICGGSAVNVVPDRATAEIDVRFNNLKDFDELKRRVLKLTDKREINGTRSEVIIRNTFPPMETTKGVLKLFDLVRETSIELGFGDIEKCTVGGGADSAYCVLSGAPVICAIGPRGGMNHSIEEFVEVESILERTKLLTSCIMKIGSKKKYGGVKSD
ncbi:MAG: M20 family metallopeptidase [Firmicutes bacterium]|nr:M20 family metallopeptidase [Bacillota bacterium]